MDSACRCVVCVAIDRGRLCDQVSWDVNLGEVVYVRVYNGCIGARAKLRITSLGAAADKPTVRAHRFALLRR
jgi:hypothetical protein